MNFILTKRWLGGTLIALALVVPSGGIAYFVKHNRYDTLCFLRALSFLSPDVMSYSEMIEAASAGNDERSLYMQQQLIFTYSHAEWGMCLPHDDHKFYDFIEKTAEQGWEYSQIVYILITGKLRNSQLPRVNIPDDGLDIEGAFSYLLDAAEKEDHYAQLLLSAAYATGQWGDMYLDNDNCIITHPRPNPSLQQHAGYRYAMCSYTDTIAGTQPGEDSLNIGKDDGLSITWLKRAVDGSSGLYYETAKYDLATRYRYGKYGAIQDYERALELFSALAMGGDTPAMVQLAWMYVDGAGVRRSIETARSWMKEAMAKAPSSKEREFYQMVYNQLPIHEH